MRCLFLISKGEDIMAIKVLTTRKFKRGAIKEAHELLARLREAGTVRAGFVSGHTLTSAEDPHTLLVISTWTDTKNWRAWQASEKRRQISDQISELLETSENVAIFHVERKEYEADMA
jgi:heme-degrading monooxygenase HmoA